MIINVSYFLNTCNSQNFNFQKKIHVVARNFFFRPEVISTPNVSNFCLLNIVPGDGKSVSLAILKANNTGVDLSLHVHFDPYMNLE